MPRVGFEPTTPLFEQAKTLNALKRAVNVFGFGKLHFECSLVKTPAICRTIRISMISTLVLPIVNVISKDV
jgi:hypothetical protein